MRIESITNIGKESNHLEEVESGLVHAADQVDTVYPDPHRDPWRAVVRALQKLPLKVFERDTGKRRVGHSTTSAEPLRVFLVRYDHGPR